jgi:hypothetical protein
MLEELRTRIGEQTRSRKAPNLTTVVRTFCVCASASLVGLREQFRLTFPALDPMLDRYLVWLGSESDLQKFATLAREAINAAFDATLNRQLAERNFSVVNSVNQVVVFADLADGETCANLGRICDVLRDVLGEYANPNTAFYWIGAFLLRNGRKEGEPYPSGAEYEATIARTELFLADRATTSNPSNAAALSSLFARVYLLDMRNAQAETLTSNEQHYVLQQLLHFLTSYAVHFPSEHDYAEWLNRMPADGGYVCALGCAAITLPVDQLLELVSLYRGAELFQAALLSSPPAGREQYYVDRFKQELALVNFEDTEKMLAKCPGLHNPLVASLTHSRDEEELQAYEWLDAMLPMAGNRNEALMHNLAQAQLRELGNRLETYLDEIVTGEIGGLRLAMQFLKVLHDHLQVIMPESAPEAAYEDPTKKIIDIRKLLASAPDDKALAARAAVGGAMLDLGALAAPVTGLEQGAWLVGLPVAIAGLTAAVRHMKKQEIFAAFAELDKLVRAKWEKIQAAAETRVAKKLLENAAHKLEGLVPELDAAVERTNKIAKYFCETYSPEFPVETAVCMLLLKDREQCLKFAGLCPPVEVQPASTFLERQQFLWRRMAGLNAALNAWEIHVVEHAAMHMLPNCGTILNLSVLAVLSREPQLLEILKRRVVQAASPFLVLTAGADQPTSQVLIEADPDRFDAVLQQVSSVLRPHYSNVTEMLQASKYALLLYGFFEGVRRDQVSLRGVN